MDRRQGTQGSRSAVALIVCVGWLAACQAHTQDIERKLDDVARAQRDEASLATRVDQLVAELTALDTTGRATEHRLDELQHTEQRTIDTLSAAAPARPQRREPDRAKTYAIAITGDPIIGPADAAVTMVWATEYACPYCEKVRDTLDQLRTHYGKSLRIVVKQFVVHPQVATASSLAACAADRQGKFAALDTLLWDKGFKPHQFDPPKCWETPGGCPLIAGFAKEAKLDAKRFVADMHACVSFVDAEAKVLQTFGVGAIPSFFINGRFVSGAQPIESFAALIDEELAIANQRIHDGTPAAKYYQHWIVERGATSL